MFESDCRVFLPFSLKSSLAVWLTRGVGGVEVEVLWVGPDGYTALPKLSANIDLPQTYQCQHICSPICVNVTVLRPEKMPGLVIQNGVIMYN